MSTENRNNMYELRSMDNLRWILAAQIVAKKLTDERKDRMALMRIEPGERLTVTTPWGADLGTISRGKATPKLVATDMAAILGEADPADTVVCLNLDDEAGLVEFLEANGGEQFLTVDLTKSGMAKAQKNAEKQWKMTGEAPAGWTVRSSAPTARATAANLAKEMVDDFLDAHPEFLTLQGMQPQAIEQGEVK